MLGGSRLHVMPLCMIASSICIVATTLVKQREGKCISEGYEGIDMDVDLQVRSAAPTNLPPVLSNDPSNRNRLNRCPR